MEETKTIEYIIGALGLLFFIGMGVALGYLWNESRWRVKENKRLMVDMIDSHEKSMKGMVKSDRKFPHEDSWPAESPLSLKNLRQK